MTDLLTRLRDRHENADTGDDRLDAARSELADYLADPLAPWSTAAHNALEDLAVISARRTELHQQVADLDQAALDAARTAADALAAGEPAPEPDPTHATRRDALTDALTLLEGETTTAARRLLTAQADDIATWAHTVYEDNARTAERRTRLLSALEEYTGHPWAPAPNANSIAATLDRQRVDRERTALAAAIDIAVAAAGLPRGLHGVETAPRPAPTRTLGADGYRPLLDVGTSTDYSPERERIAAEVTERVRVTWTPALPVHFGVAT